MQNYDLFETPEFQSKKRQKVLGGQNPGLKRRSRAFNISNIIYMKDRVINYMQSTAIIRNHGYLPLDSLGKTRGSTHSLAGAVTVLGFCAQSHL